MVRFQIEKLGVRRTEKQLTSDDHHFGGLYQSVCPDTLFETQVLARLPRDDGYNLLSANIQDDLRQQTVHLNFGDGSVELVPPADCAEAGGLSRLARAPADEAVDFVSRNAMMSARGFDGTHLAPVNPLLQSRITDAEFARGIRQLEKFHRELKYGLIRYKSIHIYGIMRFYTI